MEDVGIVTADFPDPEETVVTVVMVVSGEASFFPSETTVPFESGEAILVGIRPVDNALESTLDLMDEGINFSGASH